MSLKEAGPELLVLDNGVRLALDPMPLETAALGVWVQVGARWEAAEQNGIAHLFEHMAFKGAGGRNARLFAETAENLGAYLNAATSYERTSYTGRALSEHAPDVLDLIADMVLDPMWAAEDLKLEKGVVAQERGEAFDQPDDRVFEIHQRGLFPDQPLGRPILGEERTVAAVSVDDLAAFRRRHATPRRVVIVAAGGFDPGAIRACAERRFAELATGEAEPCAPARPHGVAETEHRKLEQTHLAFSWPAPPAGTKESVAAWLLAEILGGGMASRLFQEVRETRGLAYAVSAYIDAYEDAGRIGVYAGCAAGKAKEVALCVADEMAQIAARGVTEAELARAKAVVAAQALMGAESPLARAEARASQVFLYGQLIPLMEIKNRILAVTLEDVRRIAEAACAGPAAAAALGPKSGLAAASAFEARFG